MSSKEQQRQRKLRRARKESGVNVDFKAEAVRTLCEIREVTPATLKSCFALTKTLAKQDPVCQLIEKYVVNGQAHSFGLRVLDVIQVKRHHDTDFNSSSSTKGLFRMMLWHGTERDNVAAILEQNFHRPKANGQMFGNGIYFADRASKSAQYFDRTTQGSVGFLLLCDVALGSWYNAKNPHHEYTAPPSVLVNGQWRRCHSVKCSGKYVPRRCDQQVLYGSVVPLGRTVEDDKFDEHTVLFNEFVVYNPKQIKVMFVVKVSIVKKS